MEAKKTGSAVLSTKSNLFRSIGLLTSMVIVVTAFQWKSYEEPTVELQRKNTNTFEEVLDIPATNLPPPPPPQVLQPQVVEVPNEEEIKIDIKMNLDVEVTDYTKIEQIVIQPLAPVVEEEEETERIFTFVQESASPKGGMAAFYTFVKENIKYPAQARRMGIQGRVFVEFVIAKDGSLTDVRSVKGIGAGCDEEAIRIVQSAPAWNPGKQRGRPVRQRYTLPIIFMMANAN